MDRNCIVYNGNKLNKLFVASSSLNEKNKILDFLFKYFRRNEFPYPIYNKKELLDDWNKLLKFNTKDIEKNNIISDFKLVGTKIFKYYSKHIFEVKSNNKPSMIDAFNDDNLLLSCLKNRLGITYGEHFNITPAMLRQGFRNSYISSHISVFKPTIAKFIYEKYTNENDIVYDFSVGFGQRFIGAMSTCKNLKYIGCDPWIKSINSLYEINNFLNGNIYLEHVGAENFCPLEYKDQISLAFSSPPYFDSEIYDNNDATQAYHNGYEQYLNWFDKVLQNIKILLKPNGILALNITENIFKDIEKYLIGFKLIDKYNIQLSRNLKFSDDKLEPIYILKKVAHNYNEIENDTVKTIINRYVSGESSESIAKDLGINGSTVCRKLKKYGIKIRPSSQNKIKHNKNDAWLKVLDDENKAYFLGLMITDGTVHYKRDEVTIGLSEADADVLKQISNIIYGKEIINTYDVKGSSVRCSKLSFYGSEFKNNLMFHGCHPKKTFSTVYPINISYNLHSHFIRGLYDGDGCIYIGKNRVVVDFVGTEMLADGIAHIINDVFNLNIKFSKYKGKKHKKTICSMRINRKQDVLKFLDFIYKNASIFIKRKHDKYNLIKSANL